MYIEVSIIRIRIAAHLNLMATPPSLNDEFRRNLEDLDIFALTLWD
jgi:hypothetical protein